MKKALMFSQLVLMLLAVAVAAPAENPPAADSAYGAYPKDYQQIVNKWLETHLVDPKSAVVEWLGEPKPAEMPAKAGPPLRGYLVEFKVNARNRFGAPTGKQKYSLLIRDGLVIKGPGSK
jgi:hypothetical protein